jgi:hypothetical protein
MASKEEIRSAWTRRVAEQRASGLSAAAWCREKGINQPSLHYWLKQLPAAEASASAPQWLAVAMDSAEDCASDAPSWTGPRSYLTLRIGRISIDIAPDFDPHLLCNVLGVLEARC